MRGKEISWGRSPTSLRASLVWSAAKYCESWRSQSWGSENIWKVSRRNLKNCMINTRKLCIRPNLDHHYDFYVFIVIKRIIQKAIRVDPLSPFFCVFRPLECLQHLYTRIEGQIPHCYLHLDEKSCFSYEIFLLVSDPSKNLIYHPTN